MEAKKEARMKKIRQELADKEMAQCSFKPMTRTQLRRSSCDAIITPRPRSSEARSYSGSQRPSYDDNFTSEAGAPRSYANIARGVPPEYTRPEYAMNAGSASDDSEYWDGDDDA